MRHDHTGHLWGANAKGELYRRARDSADAAWERVPCVAQRANQKAYAPFGVAHFVADADAVWAVRADDGRLMRCVQCRGTWVETEATGEFAHVAVARRLARVVPYHPSLHGATAPGCPPGFREPKDEAECRASVAQLGAAVTPKYAQNVGGTWATARVAL